VNVSINSVQFALRRLVMMTNTVLTYRMDIFERLSGPILPLPGRNIIF